MLTANTENPLIGSCRFRENFSWVVDSASQGQQVAAGEISDGQWIAVAPIAEHELALADYGRIIGDSRVDAAEGFRPEVEKRASPRYVAIGPLGHPRVSRAHRRARN